MACPPASAVQAAAVEAGIPWSPLRVRPEYSPWAFWRRHRIARSFLPGVLHLNDPHAISLGVYARCARTAPLVIGHRWMAKRPHHVLSYLLGTDGVVAIREVACRRLAAAGYPAERIVVAPACVDPVFLKEPTPVPVAARPRWHLPLETFVYVVVASLIHGKGHDTLLQAFCRVRKPSGETYLLVVGDGPLRPSLEARANEWRVSARVRFTGVLSGKLYARRIERLTRLCTNQITTDWVSRCGRRRPWACRSWRPELLGDGGYLRRQDGPSRRAG